METDILVIGSGMAGAISALTAADQGCEVLLVTKSDHLRDGNTDHAQGGIVFKGLGDSPELLKADILKAGAGHSFEPAVDILCQQGPELVERLLINRFKVPFAFENDGDEYHRTAEAAHSIPRILHAKDQTGRAIATQLIQAVEDHPKITTAIDMTALDLLTTSHHSADSRDVYKSPACFGAYLFNRQTHEVQPVFASQTILATGGVGQLFLHTTNPAEARGDGIAMAWRAGARCINLHYIQFHPTALYYPGGRFLISEALRGEGGVLIDANGEEFMQQFHPDGNLAPRDVVARGIHNTMIATGAPCVHLDITQKPADWIKARFPSIYGKCEALGIDISQDPIPVVPAAHYSCGGVAVDTDGLTSIANLYAVGEVSATGVHGANRLASTSLLECLVWGYNAGLKAAAVSGSEPLVQPPDIRPWTYEKEQIDPALITQDWGTVKHIMWNYVGLVRTPKRMHRARTMLRQLQMEIEDFYKSVALTDDIIGLRNGVQTALAILFAASEDHISRGCHFVADDAEA